MKKVDGNKNERIKMNMITYFRYHIGPKNMLHFRNIKKE